VTNLAEEVIQNFIHNTNVAPGETETLAIDPMTLEGFDLYRYRIINVNGEPDVILSGNVELVRYDRRRVNSPAITLEIQTDEWGYEIYWEMRSSSGEIVASGGNELVGPNGGGAQTATEDDPGAYPQFETITEEFSLPNDVNDCYELLIVDDYGDGLSGGGFFRLLNETGDIVLNTPFATGDFEAYLIDAQLGVSNNENSTSISAIKYAPNPVTEVVNLDFSLSQKSEIGIRLFDVLGKELLYLPRKNYEKGQHNISLKFNQFPSGIYFLNFYSVENNYIIKLIKK